MGRGSWLLWGAPPHTMQGTPVFLRGVDGGAVGGTSPLRAGGPSALLVLVCTLQHSFYILNLSTAFAGFGDSPGGVIQTHIPEGLRPS